MNLKKLLTSQVFHENISSIKIDEKCIINTINPHSYCESKKDKCFKKALLKSDVLLPDGFGIVLATKFITGRSIKKISGADIHQFLLEKANLTKQKVFYLGSSENALFLIEKRIKKEFPDIQVSSFSPPYKAEFSENETKTMLEAVNTFNPNILFVGMTAPKQEKWVYENEKNLNANVITSIGAVFDFYAGTVKRSGKIWIKLGLEWLPRFLRDPKRLWRRNLVSTQMFLWDMLKTKIL